MLAVGAGGRHEDVQRRIREHLREGYGELALALALALTASESTLTLTLTLAASESTSSPSKAMMRPAALVQAAS